MLKIVWNLLEKTQAGPQKRLQNAQNSSNLLRMSQNVRMFSLLSMLLPVSSVARAYKVTVDYSPRLARAR